MQHKISGDEVRQIDGYATIYRQITTDANLLAVCSDTAIDTIREMVPDADPADSFLLTADALQAVIELMYLKGIQDGAPDEPVKMRCKRCKADLLNMGGIWVTTNCSEDQAGLDRCSPPYLMGMSFQSHVPAAI